MAQKFQIGQQVQLVGDPSRVGVVVAGPRQIHGELYYDVLFNLARAAQPIREEALEPYAKPSDIRLLLRRREFADKDRFLVSMIYKKLERPLSDNLYTFYSSRTMFQVHQFKPVLKFLGSLNQRLLIADEVGLGKTIEAGIILTELEARLGELDRVLVVCPSMLMPKWKTELGKRFDQDFNIVGQAQVREFLQRYKERGSERFKAIVSIQLLRRAALVQALQDVHVHFDLVIVDEAHYMCNPETRSSDLGEALTELADAMLLLTATPLQLRSGDLFNLLRILAPEEFTEPKLFQGLIEPNQYINQAKRQIALPELALASLQQVENTSQADRFRRNPFYCEVKSILAGKQTLTDQEAIKLQSMLVDLNTLSHIFTRTKKRDVEASFPMREARVVRVQFSEAEMDFYNAVTAWVESHFAAARGGGQGISFARIMPQRQVASCIPAMKEYLEEAINASVLRAPVADNGDVIDEDRDDSDEVLSNSELCALRRLRQALQRVGTTDTKYVEFLKALRALDEEAPDAKIIVFSFFKGTLKYLERKLAHDGYAGRTALIHGDIPTADRQKTLRKFRSSDTLKILLSSEVGGEGLDLEFCSVIFNYDLPWNPMRIEQRIGRLDRFGQTNPKVLIYNFAIHGTIDSVILERLYGRINIFEQYIGDLEAILGEEIASLTREMFNPNLTHEQKARYVEQIALNIVKRQGELESFEAESARFVGQDQYFNVEIGEIKRTRRFVGPQDVEHLLRTFISTNCPATTLKAPRHERAGVYVLKPDEEFRRFVWAFTQQDADRGPWVDRMNLDDTLVTFDSDPACKDERLLFVTIHCPLVRAMKRWYDGNPDQLGLTSCLRIQGPRDRAGRHFFFIYLLEKSGLKEELELVPVLVGLDGKRFYVVDDKSEWFLGRLSESEDMGEIPEFTDEQLERGLAVSEECMAMLREDAEHILRKTNDLAIENRILSLKQACGIKCERIGETIEKLRSTGVGEDDSIMRLYRGTIRIAQERNQAAIADLERRRAVFAGFELILGGLITIEPEGSSER